MRMAPPAKEELEAAAGGADQKSSWVAVVFGSSGLVGKELVVKLLSSTAEWNKVYGVARRGEEIINSNNNNGQYPNYEFISCDLLNPSETQEKLSKLDHHVTHLFWVTWASEFPLDTQECCDQNKSMMCNALDAILPRAKALRHFSLQTGAKHYVSLQQGGGTVPLDHNSYYEEESPRVSRGHNFYYVLEDLLQERLASRSIAWSVHRPGLLMGSSHRSLFNVIGSLCIYAAICNHLNLPFAFGGSRECWEQTYIDASDARLVAAQHIWAASHNIGEALNVVNGDTYTWKEIWGAIGLKLGSSASLFSPDFRYSIAMSDKGETWKQIVAKEGLVKTEMEDLANWEFLDSLFRCPAKILASRQKADCLGFTTKYQTLDSIMYWIDVMRQDKLIP